MLTHFSWPWFWKLCFPFILLSFFLKSYRLWTKPISKNANYNITNLIWTKKCLKIGQKHNGTRQCTYRGKGCFFGMLCLFQFSDWSFTVLGNVVFHQKGLVKKIYNNVGWWLQQNNISSYTQYIQLCSLSLKVYKLLKKIIINEWEFVYLWDCCTLLLLYITCYVVKV